MTNALSNDICLEAAFIASLEELMHHTVNVADKVMTAFEQKFSRKKPEIFVIPPKGSSVTDPVVKIL